MQQPQSVNCSDLLLVWSAPTPVIIFSFWRIQKRLLQCWAVKCSASIKMTNQFSLLISWAPHWCSKWWILVPKRTHLMAAWPASPWGTRSTLREAHEPWRVSGSFLCSTPLWESKCFQKGDQHLHVPGEPLQTRPGLPLCLFQPPTSGTLWLAAWKAIEKCQPPVPHAFPTQGAGPPPASSTKQVCSRLSNTMTATVFQTPSLDSRGLREEGIWKSQRQLKSHKNSKGLWLANS